MQPDFEISKDLGPIGPPEGLPGPVVVAGAGEFGVVTDGDDACIGWQAQSFTFANGVLTAVSDPADVSAIPLALAWID